DLRTALVALTDRAEFRAAGIEQAYSAIHSACDRVRGYTDCWSHAQAVAGAIDALLDPGLSAWDVRATEVLIEEAGGACRLRPSRIEGKVDLLCGSPALVEQIARLISFR